MTNFPPPGAGDPSTARGSHPDATADGAAAAPTASSDPTDLADPTVPTLDDVVDTGDPVIDTSNDGLDDGINRCPKCGSTDVQLRATAGELICLFCRHQWSEARLDETIENRDLTTLTGTTIGSGASDIDASVDVVMTMKCSGCGAEVVVNTAESMTARCHWCRHVLTVNEQIPNGAVPDAVLPFAITHEDAVGRIKAFAGKRKLFADRAFAAEFKPENIVGVYMPYMVVDSNASADISGEGEIQTRKYTRGSGDNEETVYDADRYEVRRHVDFTVDDLTVESSAERANFDASANTNNIINTILPFDTENAVKWNASYLTGYTSEKRDQDVAHLVPEVEDQLLSIARSQVEPSVKQFDRGVRWEVEKLDVHGTRWVSMYLPVWLYSYYHEVKGKGMVHYIAVNGRTGEVMGSVPVSHKRLLAAAVSVGGVIDAGIIAIMVASS
ncbi:MAG: TFIIB-type zinc ribbon-containing protein [Ilumatobacter fluminis]|uniref:TFIIB-type zinc ribbon-containing protein n=1 Tax=Ilumatobacter fluminis TaxID=467091 RepID=UPI0032EC3299